MKRIEVINGAYTWYLRGTVWTSDITRAATFPDETTARAALDRAKPFTKPALFKRATIKDIPATEQAYDEARAEARERIRKECEKPTPYGC